MSLKMCVHLLILCGIVSQGIIGTFGNEESSDILLRQKRVVSYLPGEDILTSITAAPYIVNIRYKNRSYCIGNILSHRVVITIAQCFTFERWEYTVLSGSSRTNRNTTSHDVIEIKKHFGGHPSRPEDGIALLSVNPYFTFGPTTSHISLHSGPLLEGTVGLVIGWGYNYRCNNNGTNIRFSLRSIEVPIISHRECVNIFRRHFVITEKEVCTYHPQRHCGDTDGGSPLVVDGQLAGIRLWTLPKRDEDNPQYPDVFLILQDIEYSRWLRTNM